MNDLLELLLFCAFAFWLALPPRWTGRRLLAGKTFLIWYVLWFLCIWSDQTPPVRASKALLLAVFLYLSYRDEGPSKRGRWRSLIRGALTQVQERVMQRHVSEVSA